MKKCIYFLLFAIAIGFSSCYPSDPEVSPFVGKWQEEPTMEENENYLGIWSYLDTWSLYTLNFQDNDTLKYSEVPNPNGNVILTWAGIHLDFHYAVVNDSMKISYKPKNSYAIVQDSFQYTTNFKSIDTILIISNFSFDGKSFKELKLRKE